MSDLSKVKVSESLDMLITDNVSLSVFTVKLNELKYIIGDDKIEAIIADNLYVSRNPHIGLSDFNGVINSSDIVKVKNITSIIVKLAQTAPNPENIGFLVESNVDFAFTLVKTIMEQYPELLCKYIHRQLPSIFGELAIVLCDRLEVSVLYSVNNALRAIVNSNDYLYNNNIKFIAAALKLNPLLKKTIEESTGVELNKYDFSNALSVLTTDKQKAQYSELKQML